MHVRSVTLTLVGLTAVAVAGCIPGFDLAGLLTPGTTNLVAGVSAKAEDVAQNVGGQSGFGGEQMNGYRQHFGSMMGFRSMGDLADEDGQMRVRFHNESDEECTFHLVYAASHMELEDQTMDIVVGPGETMDVDIPCAEILGLGSMTEVGEIACEFDDGQMFGNEMCVPGFMNADYNCGGMFECFFGPDEDDVDGDGNTEEMMATTQALHDHLGSGGMMGHGHGMGGPP